MILGVTLAEKAERAKQLIIFKATRGYDPERWVKATPQIRDEVVIEPEYQCIDLVPHTKGKHRFMHCQAMYEQVHSFLKKRSWAPVSNDGEVSGITWIELFVLFDIAGERTEQGQYQKNPAATKRAARRKLASRCASGEKTT